MVHVRLSMFFEYVVLLHFYGKQIHSSLFRKKNANISVFCERRSHFDLPFSLRSALLCNFPSAKFFHSRIETETLAKVEIDSKQLIFETLHHYTLLQYGMAGTAHIK